LDRRHGYFEYAEGFRGVPYILEKGSLIDNIVLIHEENFNATISNDQRLAILSLLAKGVTRASQLAENIGVVRTAVYRHLHFLENHGWIVKHGEDYLLTSKIYLVYRVYSSPAGASLEVLENKGAFIDDSYGLLVIVSGVDASKRCTSCLLIDLCRSSVDAISRRFDVSESEIPSIRIISSLSKLVKMNIESMLRKGFVVLKK